MTMPQASNVLSLSRDRGALSSDVIAAIGRNVVAEEAAALQMLADQLDGESFAGAVAAVVGTAGRVVLTGMGKSGHVARKTAATMASVGIPALFVHPAEAAHGDLGMLVAGDLLIAFSNSGSTRELAPLLRHAVANQIVVVAVSARDGSPLAVGAHIHLLLPDVAEAGPGRLAPTTSSTMMIALGDALAIAASECRGCSRSRFGSLHPAGDLGARLGLVRVLMHVGADMPIVAMGDMMGDAILTMTECSFGIAGIVDGDRLVGVITDGDLRRHIDRLMVLSAGEVMTRYPITIAPGATAEDALTLMNAHAITALFVVDPARPDIPIGLVHIHDFVRLGMA